MECEEEELVAQLSQAWGPVWEAWSLGTVFCPIKAGGIAAFNPSRCLNHHAPETNVLVRRIFLDEEPIGSLRQKWAENRIVLGTPGRFCDRACFFWLPGARFIRITIVLM